MPNDPVSWYRKITRLVRQIRRKTIDAREKLQEDNEEAAQTIRTYLQADFQELTEEWEKRLPQVGMGNLGRHVHFGETQDYREILLHDLPEIEKRAEEELPSALGTAEGTEGTASVAALLARAAGLFQNVERTLQPDSRNREPACFDPATFMEYFQQYAVLSEALRASDPLFADLPERGLPEPVAGSDFDGRGYIPRGELQRLQRDLEYVLTVWSEAMAAAQTSRDSVRPDRVFISHGSSTEWYKVQAHIERELGIETLELTQEPNRGRTVLQKLSEESDKCGFAVVVMTGDDVVSSEERPRARENVLHEIGFFQAKFGLARVCLLYEEGTNIPSNIHGLVYSAFPNGRIEATFEDLRRELVAAGFSDQG